MHGEVFQAAYDGKLPVFIGPAGTSKEIAIQYRILPPQPRGDRHDAGAWCSVTPRRAWQVRLEGGPTLELGREDVEARLARFSTCTSARSARSKRRIDYVDLRYANGFAVRIPELKGRSTRRKSRARGAQGRSSEANDMSKSRDNKKLVVGLDIGTSKIAAIVAEIKPDGGFEIIGMGNCPSRGLKKGVVVNIETTVNAIQRALEEAELMADCKIREVYTGIAGSHIKSFNSQGMVAIKDKEVGAARHRSRDRDREGGADPERPADPAHPQPGIHHRRPGGRARAARHDAACAWKSRCTSSPARCPPRRTSSSACAAAGWR